MFTIANNAIKPNGTNANAPVKGAKNAGKKGSAKETRINEEIQDAEVRLLSEDGERLGIMSAADALKLAEEKDLDLVKIAPNATPPVCKIVNYSKFKYERAKREKEQRKNRRVMEVKEIRLSLNIDVHDFETKLKQTKKFVESGSKVKVSIRFRGREMAHTNLGLETMQRFADSCSEFANVEKQPKLEGRSMIMFIAPKSKK